VWGLILFLCSLKLTSQLIDIPDVGLIMILMGFITMILAYLISAGLVNNRVRNFIVNNEYLRNCAKILLKIWVFGSLLDIIYSGGLPLAWILIGDYSKNYTDFGIPSLHGVLNACFLQAVSIYFYLWCIDKRGGDLRLLLILLFWPILMLGRGIFLSAVIQMCAIYLMLNKVRFSNFIKLLCMAGFLVFLFGLLGDIRNTPNPFDYLLDNQSREIFDGLPSGFLWVYIYITSGINNIFYNIDIISPSFYPNYSLSNLIPSSIKMILHLDPRNDALIFADDNLNISTNYSGFFSDFGPIGAVFCIYIIQQIAVYLYIKTKSGKVQFILAYSVMFQVLIFSGFYDMFLLLPTLMQLFIAYIIGNNISKKSYKNSV
jgi:oligosaccharide repeat unit polymerase